MKATRRALASLTLSVAVMLTGCIYVSDVQVHDMGTEITEVDLVKVQPGKTTREELVQWFGQPMAIKQGEGGSEQFFYTLIRQTTARKTIMVLYSSGSQRVKVIHHVFDVRNGVVQGCKKIEQ